MSSLQELSMKLSLHRTTSKKRERQGQGDDTGNLTGNTSKLELWAKRIHEEGNHPPDWMEYIKYMHCVADCMTDEEKRYNLLSGLYNKALESIPQEFIKDETYAKILVDFAKLRSQQDKSSAELLFKKATSDCRHFSFVHVAAAEFYVAQGDAYKAKRVLEKAIHVYHPKPIEHVKKVLADIVGKAKLDSTGHTGNMSQVFREDTGSTDAFSQANDKPEKENAPPQKRCSYSSTSDEADTMPIMKCNDPSKPDDHQPRKLRSYHSTPDCKNPGTLSTEKKESNITTRKRMPLGRAMRIRANQLPQVTETDDDSSDEEGMKGIKPLKLDSPPTGADTEARSQASVAKSGEENPACDFKQPPEVKKERRRDHIYSGDRKYSVMDVDEDVKPIDVASGSFTHPPPPVLADNDVEMRQEVKQPAARRRYPSNSEHDKENYPVVNPKRSPEEMGQPPKYEQPPMPGNAGNTYPFEMSGLDRKFSLMDVEEYGQSDVIGGLPKPQPVQPQFTVAPVHPARNPSILYSSSKMNPVAPHYQLSTPVHHPGMMPGVMPYRTPVGNVAPACTPMQNPNDLLIVSGKAYSILKVIGRGGSSKVYEVFEISKRTSCAIKKVDLNDADEFTVQSYMNEISLLKRLQYSDKIIKMYDYEYDEANNILYVVMERGDTDLANYFKNKLKCDQISPVMIKFYWAEMLQAVQVLHKEGIVHSDLKPANFLLVAGNVKLIDFGIANAIQQDKTSVTRELQIGTLNYMSPEAISQAECGQVYDSEGRLKPRFKLGVKSDVWSLGCILYYMVYRKAPFHHIGHNMAKLQAIINPNVPIPFPEIKDKNLMHVLKNCLKRNPKERLGIDELLQHPYLKQEGKSPPGQATSSPQNGEAMLLFNKLVMQLSGVDSPNSAQNISKNLIQQLKTGQALDLGSLVQQKKQGGHSNPS